MENDLTEHKLDSQLLHQGKVLSYTKDRVKLSNGNQAIREVVWHPGGVVILAHTPLEQVVLVKQFRYATGQTLWELPAGRLNPYEEPQLAAERELLEETGYRAKQLKPLGQIYAAPGFCSERLFVFEATDLTPGPTQPDPDELLEVYLLSIEELGLLIRQGQIYDAKTLAAWCLWQNRSN